MVILYTGFVKLILLDAPQLRQSPRHADPCAFAREKTGDARKKKLFFRHLHP